MVSTRRVATDTKRANDLSIAIQRHPTTKENQSTCDLILTSVLARWRCKEFRVE
jgi:hypothetical protein